MTSLILAAVLGGALLGQASVDLPKGYRFPTEADYSLDWKEFRTTTPTRFHVRADFDGDSVIDEAWILLATQRPGWGVFVFLGSSRGLPRAIRLDVEEGTNGAQSFGLALARPGQHRTACGKGYWACKPGEPEVLNLRLSGI